MTSYNDADNAQFEYTCTLSILNADQLTVGEYSKVRKEVMNDLLKFFKKRTKAELQKEQSMREVFDATIDNLEKQWSSDALQIHLEYFFIPLEGTDKLSDSVLEATCKDIAQNHSNSDIRFSIESIYCIPQ